MSGKNEGWLLKLGKDDLLAELLVREEAQVSEEALLEAVKGRGICFGLLDGAVGAALATRGTFVPLARGTAPLAGKNAELVLHVDEAMLSGDAVASVGKDLRQQVQVPAVEAGTLLAEVIPPSAGTPGVTIFGKEIKPPSPRQLFLRALQGAVLSADGTQVTAIITGRPRMEKKNTQVSFLVQPFYTHRGDVTPETGLLTFKGDIVIFGNVTEGTAVTATGSITVHGTVAGAQVSAGHHVTVTGNVIRSTVTAGQERLLSLQALSLLEETVVQVTELADASRQLAAHAQLAKVPFPHLVRQLIQSRYACLPERLATLQKTLQAAAPEDSLLGKASRKYRTIQPHLQTDGWQTSDSIHSAAQSLAELSQLLEGAATHEGNISVVYVLNSRLQAGRSIMVKGQGCMYSELTAGEEIHVHGRLRSSKVAAHNYIYAREAGSEAGAATDLRVSADGRIEVDRAFENAVLVVGEKTLEVTTTIGRSKTAEDNDGRLVLLPRF